jgi:hypothetical protein
VERHDPSRDRAVKVIMFISGCIASTAPASW